MLKRISLFTMLLIVVGVAWAGPAWAIDQNRIKTSFTPALEENKTHGEKDFWSFYISTYDENGPRAQWDSIPGGLALQLAAQDYALLTEDYDVSLSDVVDNGLWPYDTFPPGTNMDDRLYGFTSFQNGYWDPETKQPYGPPPGSVDWWVQARAEILDCFYKYYYYSIIDLDHTRTAEIGPKYAAFWTNPATGQPMVESDKYGDYWQCDLARIASWSADTNYLNPAVLPNVDAILAALQTAPIKPVDNGRLEVDLSGLGPRFPGAMTFWTSDERVIRSRDTAVMFAKEEVLSRLKNTGKLEFPFKVQRINSIKLPQE